MLRTGAWDDPKAEWLEVRARAHSTWALIPDNGSISSQPFTACLSPTFSLSAFPASLTIQVYLSNSGSEKLICNNYLEKVLMIA